MSDLSQISSAMPSLTQYVTGFSTQLQFFDFSEKVHEVGDEALTDLQTKASKSGFMKLMNIYQEKAVVFISFILGKPRSINITKIL